MANETKPPPVPAANRAHVEMLVRRAERAAEVALDVARSYGLAPTAERIAWAQEFLADAREQAAKGAR